MNLDVEYNIDQYNDVEIAFTSKDLRFYATYYSDDETLYLCDSKYFLKEYEIEIDNIIDKFGFKLRYTY